MECDNSGKDLADRISKADICDAETIEKLSWALFLAVAHFSTLAIHAKATGSDSKADELNSVAASLKEALVAMKALAERSVDTASLTKICFGTSVRAISSLVTQAVCWNSVMLVSVAKFLNGSHTHAEELAVDLRTALLDFARCLHGKTLPTISQRVFRDEGYAKSVNELFTDRSKAHIPDGFIKNGVSAERVESILTSRGSSLVAIIESMSGFVAASF